MIRIALLLSLSALITISCSSTKSISENSRISNCSENFKNDYSRIEFDETFLAIDNKTQKITEAKFFCLHSFLQTKKIMYDAFGKWNDETLGSQSQHPRLIWKAIPLLKNSTQKFTILADGEEPYKEETYASISVLDENGQDALATNSQFKELLVEFFSSKIKQTDHQSEEFHKVYLKKVSPKKYEKLYGAKP